MPHFNLALWQDFARGGLPQEQQSTMAAHLREGCQQCQAAVEFLARAASAAAGLAVEVPPDVVQRAEAIAEPHASAEDRSPARGPEESDERP